MTTPCQGADPTPHTPNLVAPHGACDSHFHIFGPVARFPFQTERSFTPPEVSIAAYEHVVDTLRLSRCVIVQPSVYGTDNSCTSAALAALGERCRGVAVVAETVSHAELERLHAEGFRGVRFNLLFKGGLRLDALEGVARKIARVGWHIQLLLDARELPDLATRLRLLPVPIVVDHMGHMPTTAGLGHPGFQALLALLGEGRCWVKVSGAYRISNQPAPYRDVVPFARALIDTAPESLVWGTDWPHPAVDGEMPNDGDLLDLVADWTADATLQRKILVDNPAALYGF